MGIVWQFYSKDRFPFWCPFWGIVLFLKRKDRFEIFKTENDWKIVFKNKRKSENSCFVLKRKTEKIVFRLKQNDGLTLSTFL